MASAPDETSLRPSEEIPRPGVLEVLRGILTGGGGRRDMLSGLRRQHQAHGPVVMLRMGPMRMVNLFGPDANRLVLLDRERIFSARKPWDAIMGRIFPRGLLLRDGDDHKHHRKIMHLPFKRPALREYAERMNTRIEATLDAWERGDPRRLMFPAYKELTLDMAASIFIGADLGPGTQRMNRAPCRASACACRASSSSGACAAASS
jgi:cytochrome P450